MVYLRGLSFKGVNEIEIYEIAFAEIAVIVERMERYDMGG